MKKKNNLLKFLAIVSGLIQLALIWFTTQDSFLKEYPFVLLALQSIVFLFLMVVTSLYNLKGENEGKGKSLNKKDIKVGSKIKIIEILPGDREYIFVIKSEDKNFFILSGENKILETDKYYTLNHKLEWEEVS